MGGERGGGHDWRRERGDPEGHKRREKSILHAKTVVDGRFYSGGTHAMHACNALYISMCTQAAQHQNHVNSTGLKASIHNAYPVKQHTDVRSAAGRSSL